MPIKFTAEERKAIAAALGAQGAARLAELDAEYDYAEKRAQEAQRLSSQLSDEQRAHEQTRNEREGAIGEATSAHRKTVQHALVTKALVQAGVNGAALSDAVNAFMATTQFKLRDDGTIKSSTLDDGDEYASLDVAALKFLEERSPYFHARWDRDAQRLSPLAGERPSPAPPREEPGQPPMSIAGLFAGAAEEAARVRKEHAAAGAEPSQVEAFIARQRRA